MTKKEQVKIRELVGKISDTCMRINMETKYTANFEHGGSTFCLSAFVRKGKNPERNYILFMPGDFIWMNRRWNTSETIAKLSDRLAALEKFLADELAK